jgi:uncharacterized protein (DUF58 family)
VSDPRDRIGGDEITDIGDVDRREETEQNDKRTVRVITLPEHLHDQLTSDDSGDEEESGKDKSEDQTNEGDDEHRDTDTEDDPGEEGNDSDYRDRIPTGRWEVGLSAALVSGAVGMIAGNPTLMMASTIGLGYAAYGYATRPPSLEIALEREVSERSPLPGETVEVRVTVENVGDRRIPDLRVLDDVPDEFELVDGAPGFSAALEPEETATYGYSFCARRGEYTLGPTVVVSRNVSGGEERRRELANAFPMTVEAGPRSVPVTEKTVSHTGRVETDDGGHGLEFHSTRRYHPSDPKNRIDWNRFASTNELTTINYREEQTAVVMVVADVRNENEVTREPGQPDAVELVTYASERLVDSLLDHNDRVGVALYDEEAYLKPGQGRAQSLRASRFLREGRARDDPHVVTSSGLRFGGESFVRKHLRPEAQVVLVTPLLDDDPVELVTRLEAHGYPVTVLAPDVTDPNTPGGTVARVERTHRLHDLRETGVRVVEWSPDEPLYTTVSRAERRWST